MPGHPRSSLECCLKRIVFAVAQQVLRLDAVLGASSRTSVTTSSVRAMAIILRFVINFLQQRVKGLHFACQRRTSCQGIQHFRNTVGLVAPARSSFAGCLTVEALFPTSQLGIWRARRLFHEIALHIHNLRLLALLAGRCANSRDKMVPARIVQSGNKRCS